MVKDDISRKIIAILKVSNWKNFELPDEWETQELEDLCGYPGDFLQRAAKEFGMAFKDDDLYLTVGELADHIRANSV